MSVVEVDELYNAAYNSNAARAVQNRAVDKAIKESQTRLVSPRYVQYMGLAARRDYAQRETVRRRLGMSELLPEKPWHQL